tara:strand:- start:397 stop:570 length:174 start_codon:yes stop_codon:yes gene_type:complete
MGKLKEREAKLYKCCCDLMEEDNNNIYDIMDVIFNNLTISQLDEIEDTLVKFYGLIK